MKKLMVTCLAGLVLGAVCPSAHGFDAAAVIYVVSGTHADALVSAEEFSETWSGMLAGSFLGSWNFTSRQGFRISGHAPGAGVPDLTGFGFSYGDVQLEDMFGDQYNGQYAVVEDPRLEFAGSFGRIWGQGPDEKFFEGTIKFQETGNILNGEINMVVLGDQEVYMQNTSLLGSRESRDFVEYPEAPIGIGYDMTLLGETDGFFFSSSDLSVDMTSLILQDFPWEYVACDDVLMFGEMSLPEPFAQSDFWIQSSPYPGEEANVGNGMLATSCSLVPEATIYAISDEDYETYILLMKHAVSSDLIPGDANLDGTVTDLDASILAAHWQQQSGATWCDGDFDGDGKVTDTDASILAAHWQEGVGEGAAPVPEPAPIVLLLGTLLLLARKKGSERFFAEPR